MPDETRNSQSAAARPVPLRRRPDLIIRPHRLGRRRYWVVKDPLALEYHQLRDEEYTILQMLDGHTSLEEMQTQYESAFAPQKLSLGRLQALLGMMHRLCLVVADTAGQGEQLLLRRGRKRRQRVLAAFGNILAIRLPGIAPDPFLRRIYPPIRWLFSPWCVACSLLLVLAALTLVAVQYQAVLARLPDLPSFFNPRNVLLLAVALGVTKVLHELGHALTCKHFGGECRELGILFLVFTPCLFCNVTDSWMIAGKWRRIAISLAGIYIEVVLASICTFLWWYSEPGLFHSVCLNIMVVCSVSTVFLNGNPLLRYDGYFVLSDLLEVPNLWQRSRGLVYGFLRRLCLGIELEIDRTLPRRGRWWLFLYGIASILYRTVVVAAILLFLHNLMKLYRLQSLAALFAVLVIAGLVLMPMIEFARLLRDPEIYQRLRWHRLAVACGLGLACLMACLLIPMPHRVRVPIFIDARDAQRVYVTEPGTLTRTISAGTHVQADQTLAVLAAPALRREVAKLTGEIRRVRIQLENLGTLRALDPEVAAEMAAHIPATEESLADKIAQLDQLRRNEQRLELKAPCRGFVLAPPDVAPEAGDNELPTWSGTPLQEANLGCYLTEGTLFCLVGGQPQHEAVAYIHQADVEFVRVGQPVRLLLDQLAGKTLPGTIEELAKVDARVVPRQFVEELDLPMREDKAGVLRPLETLYEARISISEQSYDLVLGSHGRAKIVVDPKPWGQRLWRSLSRTFAFQL